MLSLNSWRLIFESVYLCMCLSVCMYVQVVSMYVRAHEYSCPQRPETLDLPGAGVAGFFVLGIKCGSSIRAAHDPGH